MLELATDVALLAIAEELREAEPSVPQERASRKGDERTPMQRYAAPQPKAQEALAARQVVRAAP